jgi:hypothetical protein
VRACPCATLGQPPARLAGALHRSGRLGRGIGFFRPRPSPFEGVGEKNSYFRKEDFRKEDFRKEDFRKEDPLRT